MGPESEEEKTSVQRVNAAADLLPSSMLLHEAAALQHPPPFAQPLWQQPPYHSSEHRTVLVSPSQPSSFNYSRWMPNLLPSQVSEWQQSFNDGRQLNHALLNADLQSKLKADIVSHPLYNDLLSAHIDCLRAATPISELHSIDSQLHANSQQVVFKYVILKQNSSPLTHITDKEELDHFIAKYTMLLRALKEQLEEHVRVHAMEAVMSCWELEQALFSLTGAQPFEESSATMSDNENEEENNESLVDSGSGYLDGGDTLGLGPLIPTETERSLMERVRRELKLELKQGYRHRISSVREEILRKRRAGKLPGETTSILKKWWNSHSKWPYPTEDEKAKLVQETGLELKQINNWFINQRKRNWHNNQPSSSTAAAALSLSKGDEKVGQTCNGSTQLSIISSDAHRLANEYYL